jgi:hypothetical protein
MSLPDPPKVTLETLDERVSNIERLLVQMHGEMTPKWVRVGGWATIVGSVLGAAAKVALGGGQ